MIHDRSQIDPQMVLPWGKTCDDCVFFQQCEQFHYTISGDIVCGWRPSRFQDWRTVPPRLIYGC